MREKQLDISLEGQVFMLGNFLGALKATVHRSLEWQGFQKAFLCYLLEKEIKGCVAVLLYYKTNVSV